jgi:hypothetical protein
MAEEQNKIGFVEEVEICGNKACRNVLAKIDTGAALSSIDISLADTLGVGPILRVRNIKNAHGVTERPIVECRIKIQNRDFSCEATVADRKHMKYPLLLGQNLLSKTDFLIDPKKNS